MLLDLRAKDTCRYDAVSLGEIMLRLDPGDSRVRCARSFRAWEGGGEYNVARGLRRCFGMDTGVVTALAQNDVGYLIEDLILQGGVDTSMIRWVPFDGIGRKVRNGLNFTERGFGVRGALGVSDRANTAVSQLKPGDVDWDDVFGRRGARWFHTGGIFAALSETTAEVVIEAVKAAKRYGTIVSYDLNYRASLWRDIGGQEKARAVNREIAPYIDVMIGNEEDFTACLGFEVKGNDAKLKKLDLDGYRAMMDEVAAALRDDTEDIRSVPLGSAAVVIGSEGRGVSQPVLDACRATLKIPMRDRCESLNAAVAASVVLWEGWR